MADTTDRRTLVVNADDFGLSEEINRGIIEAFHAGALRSASIMVGMPAFDDAVQRARAAGSALGVGLHFTLTAGRPLTNARTLVDPRTGAFWSADALLLRGLMGRLATDEVEAECRAQIARAREAGVHLTHLDGLLLVHLAPGVHEAVRRVIAADGSGIPVVRRPAERLLGGSAWWRRVPERALIRLLSRGAARDVVGGSKWMARTTDHFIGSALLGARAFHTLLVRTLEDLQAGTTELMVHPGYVRAPLPGDDLYTTQREVELRALTSPEVVSRLQDASRIRLIHFGELTDEILPLGTTA